MNAVHYSALRICTVAFRSSLVVSLLADANEPSLEMRRMKLGLQHYVRLQRLPESQAFLTVFDHSTHEMFDRNEALRAPMGVRMLREVRTLNIGEINVMPNFPPEEPL